MNRFVAIAALCLLACGKPEDTDDTGDTGEDTDDTGDTSDTDTGDTSDTSDTDTGDTDTGTTPGGLDPVPGFWGVSGPGVSGAIYDLLVHDGIVYVAGEFEYVGPATGSLAAFHTGGSGEAVPTTGRAHVEGYVDAMISDGQGGYYLAGRLMRTIDGVPVSNVAHIRPDGTVDPAFQLDITDSSYDIYALAVGPNALYIGGGFYHMEGVTRFGAAALDKTTGAVLPWDPNADFTVTGFAVVGDKVYVSGAFDTIGGASRPIGLARVDATTGAADSWNPTAAASPTGGHHVTVVGDVVYQWGYGFQGEEMVAFEAGDASEITAFAPEADGQVRDLEVGASALWVAGSFEHIGGATRHLVAAIDPATGAALPFDPDWGTFEQGHDALEVFDIELAGTTLYAYVAVGPFAYDRPMVVAFDTTTGDRTAFEVITDSSFGFAAMEHDGTDLLVASSMRSAGGSTRRCLAAFDATTGLPTSWAPYVDWNGGCEIYAMTRAGSTIYFGGEFQEVDGETRRYLAAVDLSGTLLPWDPGANDGVEALYAADGLVYVGGYFSQLDGASHPWVGAVDATTGVATSWNPQADSDVLAFAKVGTTVYVGGSFESIGGEDRIYLAELDATTGLATSWNPGADDDVQALLAHDGLIYAAGRFTEVAGTPRGALAAIEPDGDLAPWDPAGEGRVQRIAIHGDTLYAGGVSASFGTAPAALVTGVDLTTGLATSWSGPGDTTFVTPAPGRLDGLAVDSAGRIFIGGGFNSIDDEPTLHLTAFDPP